MLAGLRATARGSLSHNKRFHMTQLRPDAAYPPKINTLKQKKNTKVQNSTTLFKRISTHTVEYASTISKKINLKPCLALRGQGKERPALHVSFGYFATCINYLTGKTAIHIIYIYIYISKPANVKKCTRNYRNIFYMLCPIHECAWSLVHLPGQSPGIDDP